MNMEVWKEGREEGREGKTREDKGRKVKTRE
jgi:hypothetical protein